MDGEGKLSKATFAAGSFWCAEPHFSYVAGVVSTTVGFTGGGEPAPGYAEVCAGGTGHVEAVEVVFDPARVSYEALLRIFWAILVPAKGQASEPKEQHRPAIFHHDNGQRLAAEKSLRDLQAVGRLPASVAVRIVPAEPFHPAEEYHQRYLEKRKLVGGRH